MLVKDYDITFRLRLAVSDVTEHQTRQQTNSATFRNSDNSPTALVEDAMEREQKLVEALRSRPELLLKYCLQKFAELLGEQNYADYLRLFEIPNEEELALELTTNLPAEDANWLQQCYQGQVLYEHTENFSNAVRCEIKGVRVSESKPRKLHLVAAN